MIAVWAVCVRVLSKQAWVDGEVGRAMAVLAAVSVTATLGAETERLLAVMATAVNVVETTGGVAVT